MKPHAIEDISLHPAYEAVVRTANIPKQVSWKGQGIEPGAFRIRKYFLQQHQCFTVCYYL
jgi:hypothetical protein